MSYQVFARKYRPLTFNDVLGQDHVVRTLTNAIRQNRLAHAYLFVGPRGTGKTSTARIFAKALNCTGGPRVDFDPDEDVCREIAEGRSLDVLEIDGASNRGIDHIRDLRDNVRFAPSRGAYRIVYIDEVHMLTKESFNALLKTLEEPPPHVKFIFATTEPHKILPTILSRCQRFDLRPIPADLIANHLLHIAGNEGVELTPEAAYAVAKVADGGMRDAQSMLDQLVSFCGNTIAEQQVLDIFGITSRDTVADLLSLILKRDLPTLLRIVNEQSDAGRDMGQLLSEIISAVREALVSKVDSMAGLKSVPEERRQELVELLARTKTDKILRIVEVLSETEEKMKWSTHKKLHLEIGLIKTIHSLSEANISDIIRALDGAPPDVAASLPEPATLPPPPRQAEPAPAPAPAPAPENLPPEETDRQHHPSTCSATLPPTPPGEESPTRSCDQEPLAPAPTADEEPASPLQPASLASVLSDAPVSPPEEPEEPGPAGEDAPAMREDTLTGSLFDDLDSMLPPTEPRQPVPTEEGPGEKLDGQTWNEILEQLSDRYPLKADLLSHACFLRHEEPFFVLGLHPNDTMGYDALRQDEVKGEIEKMLSLKCGVAMTLQIEYDASIPEPADGELEPLPPLPQPEAAPVKQAPRAHETPSLESREQAAAEELAKQQQAKEDFFNDPFVQQALDTFKARIIKN